MRWTDQDTEKLKELHRLDRYFWYEIAEKMSFKAATVGHHARRLGLKQGPRVRGRFAEWNVKHQHLTEPVMEYFIKHSWEETREQFNLTASELKSIFTVGYRNPDYSHLRKDCRRHDSWTVKETMFLMKHGGIKPRDWIARQLKRGTMQSTKESLSRLKIQSKYINGLPERLASLIAPSIGIKTQAGAPGPNGNCHIKIVSWAALEDALHGKKGIKPEFKIAVKALARFQRWVHKARTNKEVIRKITRMTHEK